MSTEIDSLGQSLASVDVEMVRAPPDEVGRAIKDLVVEPAVAVPLDRNDVTLPDGIDGDPTPAALRAATTGVTPAAFAVADYGTLVLPSSPAGSEFVSLFVDRHVAVLDENDVAPDMDAAFERFGNDVPDEYGSAILATGPSATADMGALVKGAHGPSEVALVVVEA